MLLLHSERLIGSNLDWPEIEQKQDFDPRQKRTMDMYRNKQNKSLYSCKIWELLNNHMQNIHVKKKKKTLKVD